ncbi:MAG TPA: hypothetical protein VHB79_22500 [Polyangiaceae bacterium]|nr:hypothetical protein [Polyangiaceae bacterium]
MNGALAHLGETNPDALRLARLASLAARVEPELLRALRLELCEEADASAEADVWWSHAVEVRSPTAIRLSPEALDELRSTVGADAERAHAVIKRLHTGEPRLIQLEEELIFGVLAGQNVGSKLEQVLGTLLDDPKRAAHVAAWAVTALPRLPAAVRDLPAFWSVLFAADAQGRGSANVGVAAPPSPEVLASAARLLPSLSGVGWVEIEPHLDDDELTFTLGQERDESHRGILARNLHPLLVEVASEGSRSVVVVERERPSRAVKVRGAKVEISTVGGRTHELASGMPEGAAPWIGALGPLPWRLWPPGTILKVRFKGRNKALQEQVLAIASEWSEHAALHFGQARAKAVADIIVGFEKGAGSWSFHGTESQRAAFDKQLTMNLDVDNSTSEDELRSVVLHEFGHVLGLVNEAQNPHARIAWNAEAIYAWGEQNNMSREQLMTSWLGTHGPPQVHRYREFDPASVMLNPVSREFTLDGFETKRATRLSPGDAAFARELYPAPIVLDSRKLHEGIQLPIEGRASYAIDFEASVEEELVLECPINTAIWRQWRNQRKLMQGPSRWKAQLHEGRLIVAGGQSFTRAVAKVELRAIFEKPRNSGLNVLRRRLRQSGVPERQEDALLIGTWHVGKLGRRARWPEAIELITEVLRRFDLTMFDNVYDVDELAKALELLGTDWAMVGAPTATATERRPVVVYDKRTVAPERARQIEFSNADESLRPQLVSSFQARGTTLQLIQIAPKNHENGADVAPQLAKQLPQWHQAHGADITIVVGFMGIEGPTSVNLDLLQRANIHLPSPLTRHGDNPPLDQFLIHHKPRSLVARAAGLIDLYQNSPGALFPDRNLSNKQVFEQLSYRSPAWVQLGPATSSEPEAPVA